MKEQDTRILRLELLGMDVMIQIRQLPANPLQPQMTEQEIEDRVESVIAYLLPDSSQHV
ncbi:hypothetical protein [Pseudomonas syringae]|uniref:hypothetical protein n=1 Tax=Pseudomonas syringae TaxID=317 RepID=UPI000A941DDE|nr:hypothetical protein [Pseudomonas syringae]